MVKVKSARIIKYKSFEDSGIIEFGPGFNIIVGANNSGKTTILESLRLYEHPHIPFNDGIVDDVTLSQTDSRYYVEYLISFSDFSKAIRRIDGIRISYRHDTTSQWIIQELNKKTPVSIGYYMRRGQGNKFPFKFLFRNIEDATVSMDLDFNKDDNEFRVAPSGKNHSLESLFNPDIQTKLHYLTSQRYNINTCSIHSIGVLSPSGDNLPAILNEMAQKRPTLYKDFVKNFSKIFPEYSNVTTPASSQNNGNVEIWLWTLTNEGREVHTPLNLCGTGVGQVLIMLTLALQEQPSVVIIDEINAFLHPSAIKTLVSILRTKYSHHQYIISTHSTDIIKYSNPDKVHLVSKNNLRSKVKTIDTTDIDQLREIAGELGVSMSDVFASDRVLWVEGETEEECFKIIFEFLNIAVGIEFTIAKVIDTGRLLQKKDKLATLIFEIYDRISKLSAPLVKHSLFVFDREVLSDAEVKELKKRAKNSVSILPRRCYENYIVLPEAIHSVFIREGIETINVEDINTWIVNNGGKQIFGASNEWKNDIFQNEWIAKVDAAKLLSEMFPQLSGGTLEYRKTKHSKLITEQILAEHPEHLSELFKFLRIIHNSILGHD